MNFRKNHWRTMKIFWHFLNFPKNTDSSVILPINSAKAHAKDMTHAYQNHIKRFPKYTPLNHRLWIIFGLTLFKLLTLINRTTNTITISLLTMTVCFQKPITQFPFTTSYMGNTILYLQKDSDLGQNTTITLATLTAN